MNIVSISEARQQGLKHYFTGKPCVHGHIAVRPTSTRICSECNRMYARESSKSEKARERTKEWHRNNPERVKEILQEWANKNKKAILADTRRQQAKKLQRTPLWSEKAEIRKFYENCPEGCEVDHIIPLAGKTVSGLHALANLQYLTMHANRSKGNRWPS